MFLIPSLFGQKYGWRGGWGVGGVGLSHMQPLTAQKPNQASWGTPIINKTLCSSVFFQGTLCFQHKKRMNPIDDKTNDMWADTMVLPLPLSDGRAISNAELGPPHRRCVAGHPGRHGPICPSHRRLSENVPDSFLQFSGHSRPLLIIFRIRTGP